MKNIFSIAKEAFINTYNKEVENLNIGGIVNIFNSRYEEVQEEAILKVEKLLVAFEEANIITDSEREEIFDRVLDYSILYLDKIEKEYISYYGYYEYYAKILKVEFPSLPYCNRLDIAKYDTDWRGYGLEKLYGESYINFIMENHNLSREEAISKLRKEHRKDMREHRKNA